MPDFGEAERRILNYFVRGTQVVYRGRKMTVREAGKPTCLQGEPKTDIYVLVAEGEETEEIKISYKKENADFLENKMNAIRAEQLFGTCWRRIIENSTQRIRGEFEKRIRIYKKKFMRTEQGAITLGWKFELLNKPGGDLSGKMNLTPRQVYDAYAGTNLSSDKKNAWVNGRKIENSGVAEYILVTDGVVSAQDIIDRMIPMEQYIIAHPDIYFACKALNYRTFATKYDGNRPLAVQVDWKIIDGKLTSDLIFDHPLEKNGDEMAGRLLACMNRLGIRTTDDIGQNNADMRKVYQ